MMNAEILTSSHKLCTNTLPGNDICTDKGWDGQHGALYFDKMFETKKQFLQTE